MVTNLERAHIISRHVDLHVVALKDAKVSSSVDPRNVPVELELKQKYRARFDLSAEHEDQLTVFVDLVLEVTRANEAEWDPILSLEATYQLIYHLPNAPEFPRDSMQHFADLNGTYNVWPYWRELVQTVCGRVGIAAIVVPVFRPAVRDLKPEEEEQVQLPLETDQSSV